MTSLKRAVKEATDRANIVIREAEYAQRYTNLELREMQLALEEDFRRLNEFMENAEKEMKKETAAQQKWIEQQAEYAKTLVDQALHSVLMTTDVQCLEKKVDVIKEAVLHANQLYYNYATEMDTTKLREQVEEAVRQTEQKEREALGAIKTDEATLETLFRATIEQLCGVKSSNPKLVEEARKLANDLRIYRDAAANGNFHDMIAKSSEYTTVSGSVSSSSNTSNLSSSSKIPSVGRSERMRDLSTLPSSGSVTSSSASSTSSSIDSPLAEALTYSSASSSRSKRPNGLSEVGSLSTCLPTKPNSAPSTSSSTVSQQLDPPLSSLKRRPRRGSMNPPVMHSPYYNPP